MTYKIQTPNEDLSWSFDWSDWLGSGETISSRQWSIDPDASPTLLTNPTNATVRVSGLTAGTLYLLTEKITTNASPNNVGERTLAIRCEDTI